MRLPKQIAALLTITLVASSTANLTFADTTKGVTSENLIGEGRWETAIEVSKKGWTKAEEAIIVNDSAIADALAATPFAESKNAPILLTQKDKLDERTKAELKRLGVKKVYLIGGEAVLTKTIEAELKAENLQTDRIYGETRELTALEIAKRLDEIKPISEIVVVNGTTGLSDAVSIAAVAADKDMAIILSNPTEGTKASDEFIKNKDIKTSYVIGGPNAISKDVEGKLPNVKRIEGIDRNETNAKVIETFYNEKELNNAYVAKDGMGKEDYLIDALSVGVLAAKNDSPVIIVGNKLNEMQKDVTNTKSFKTVTQVGGNGNEAAFGELKTMQGVTTYEVNTVVELNDALDKADANDVINVKSLNDNTRSNNVIEIKSNHAITINLHDNSKSFAVKIKSGKLVVHTKLSSIDVESGDLVIDKKGSVSTVNVLENGEVTVSNKGTSKPNVTVKEGASVEVSGKINTINVSGKDAAVSVAKDSNVSKVEVSKDASGTVIENDGKVDKVVSNASDVTVENNGTVGGTSGTNKPTVNGNPVTPPSTGGGSSGGGNVGNFTVNVKDIIISTDAEKPVIKTGATIQLKTEVKPANATNKNITWKSSDENIATVTSDGLVIGHKPGKVKITGKSNNGKEGAFDVYVGNKIIDINPQIYTQNTARTLENDIKAYEEGNVISISNGNYTLPSKDLLEDKIIFQDKGSNIEYLFAGGLGISQSPYQISKVDEFENIMFGKYNNKGTDQVHYKLTQDIDFNNVGIWQGRETEIFNFDYFDSEDKGQHSEYIFRGTLDGNGKSIKNYKQTKVYATDSEWYTSGLFYAVDKATFKNINFDNCIVEIKDYNKNENGVNVGSAYAGIIASFATNPTVDNVNITNSKVSLNNKNAGGMFGYTAGGNISNCKLEDIIVKCTGSNAGSIAGANYVSELKVTDCTITGSNVIAHSNAGGVLGLNSGSASISLKGGTINATLINKINNTDNTTNKYIVGNNNNVKFDETILNIQETHNLPKINTLDEKNSIFVDEEGTKKIKFKKPDNAVTYEVYYYASGKIDGVGRQIVHSYEFNEGIASEENTTTITLEGIDIFTEASFTTKYKDYIDNTLSINIIAYNSDGKPVAAIQENIQDSDTVIEKE